MILRRVPPASVTLIGATLLLVALIWRFAPRPWDVLGALAGVDMWLLVAAVVVNAAGVAVRAAAWRELLRHVTSTDVRFRDAFSAYVVGLVGNAVLPARAGEAARVNMLGRRLSDERAYSLVTGSVIAHRLLDCIPFALLMLAVPLLESPVAFSGVAFGVTAIALSSAAGIAIIIARRRDPAIERAGRICGTVSAMRRGAAGLGAPRTTARALALETIAWVAQLTVVWLALAAFHLPASVGAAALILVAINVAVAVPLLPGGVGLFQAATALSLGAGGTAAAAAVGFGVGLQGLEILTTLLVGLPLAAREGLLLRRLLPSAFGGGEATPSTRIPPGQVACYSGRRGPRTARARIVACSTRQVHRSVLTPSGLVDVLPAVSITEVRVLVVEDESSLADLIRQGLRTEGLLADIAELGEDAIWMASATAYDVICLDINLPDIDGFATCRRLRADGVATPILMLTARDAIDDRITGLDTGADDYLVKPFDFGELLARLRALSRRPPARESSVLSVGDLSLDLATHDASRAGVPIDLSVKELQILEVFMRRPGVVLSRLEILEGAWDGGYEHRSNVIDVYVRYLREKIDRPFGVETLETVRGAGYRLRTADA